MDTEIDRKEGWDDGTATLAERVALWVVRLVALPFLLIGLVVWGTTFGIVAVGRGAASIAMHPVRHLHRLPNVLATPVGTTDA